ncbi:ABC transporter permease [Macrococcus capreoli]
MIDFIKNEFIKVKSEKFILVVLSLSLIPFIMNLTNYLLNDKNLSLDTGFYFRLYNQYFMLIPIAFGIIGSSIYYLEFKNQTYLNWLAYSKSKYKLYFSKFLVSIAYCAFLYIINLSLIVLFYIFFGNNSKQLLTILVSFTLLNLFLIIFMLPISITTVIIFNNYIIAIVLSIALSMFSMILIAAPFAYFIPTTLSYRFGMSIIDASMGFESITQNLVGISFLLISSVILIFVGIKQLKLK